MQYESLCILGTDVAYRMVFTARQCFFQSSWTEKGACHSPASLLRADCVYDRHFVLALFPLKMRTIVEISNHCSRTSSIASFTVPDSSTFCGYANSGFISLALSCRKRLRHVLGLMLVGSYIEVVATNLG